MPYKDPEKAATRMKAYHEANREKIAAYRKAYYEANREKVLASQKAYEEANREKVAAYYKARYEANQEKVVADRKAYREANREKIAAYRKVRYKARQEKLGIVPKIKLNEEQVSQIKAHLKVGVSPGIPARWFKVDVSTIQRIAKGLIWKHVKPADILLPIRPESKLPIRLRDHRLEDTLNGFANVK